MSQKADNRGEALLSWGVLAVLALVALWVGLRQAHFNPAVEVALGRGAEAPATSRPSPAMPAALQPMSPPEQFDPQTLAEKINGKAELYLSAGFEQLTAQRFALKADPKAWLEMYVYRMKGLLPAFSVYSQQRRPGVKPLAVGGYAYQSSNALFVVHGPYYLEVVSGRPNPALLAAGRELAQGFVAATPVKEKAVAELGLFPAQGLMADSSSYLAKNAFGLSELDRVFLARYQARAGTLTAFISKRADPAEAAAKVEAVLRTLKPLGAKEVSGPTGLAEARVLDLMGATEIFMAVGPYLAGVHQAGDRDAALALAQRLKESLAR